MHSKSIKELEPNYSIEDGNYKNKTSNDKLKFLFIDVKSHPDVFTSNESMRNSRFEYMAKMSLLPLHKTIRIFDVPSKTKRNIGKQVNFDINQQKILFQYLLFNQRIKDSETHLSFYEPTQLDAKEQLKKNIFGEYVMNINYISKNPITTKSVTDWFQTKFIINDKTEIQTSVNLLNPLFEDYNKYINKSLHYKERYLKDFYERTSAINNNTVPHFNIKDQKLNSREWIRRLGLNILSTENINDLIREVDEIIPKIPMRTVPKLKIYNS